MSFLTTLRTVLTLGKGLVQGLPEATADSDPFDLFKEWYDQAEEAGLLLPEAMTLATCTREGKPSARMVLLKGFDRRGFVFYTNYESRKSHELIENPFAALVFHWAVLQRQVRVEGRVTQLTPEESFQYFKTRPHGSRIGAWASQQSAVLEDRKQLEDRVKEYEDHFGTGEVPLPPFWGGYLVEPETIEFWQGRSSRLHDRLCFSREGEGWKTVRLYP